MSEVNFKRIFKKAQDIKISEHPRIGKIRKKKDISTVRKKNLGSGTYKMQMRNYELQVMLFLTKKDLLFILDMFMEGCLLCQNVISWDKTLGVWQPAADMYVYI